MADVDGFQVVKKRKGHKGRNCKQNVVTSTEIWNGSTSSETTHCDINELRTKIEKCRHEKVSFASIECDLMISDHFSFDKFAYSVFDQMFLWWI